MSWKTLCGQILALGLQISATASQAQEPIRVGAIVSTTGPLAFVGEPEARSMQMLAERVNMNGGILGRKIELTSYDDASDSAKANGLAKRLVDNDKVDVLLCGASTGSSMAIVPIAEKSGVPFISCAGGAVLIEPTKRFVFKPSGTDRMQTERAYLDMKKRGINRVALLCETSGYGQSGRKEALAAASKFGVEIVADETYGAKDVDMTAQLTKIKVTPRVQAVLVFGAGQASVTINKNTTQLSITIPHYESAGAATPDYVKLSGASAEGVRVIGTAMFVPTQLAENDPQKKVLLDYIKSYTEKFKEDVSPFGGYAYDSLGLYLDAVQRVGSTDKQRVRDALESTKGYVGVTGIFNMSANDHMGLEAESAWKVLEIRNGSWVLID